MDEYRVFDVLAASEAFLSDAPSLAARAASRFARANRDYRSTAWAEAYDYVALVARFVALSEYSPDMTLGRTRDALAASFSAEINQCASPAWKYYLLFWPPRCRASTWRPRAKRLRLIHPDI